jgi:hypothetical protein
MQDIPLSVSAAERCAAQFDTKLLETQGIRCLAYTVVANDGLNWNAGSSSSAGEGEI